MWPSHVTGTPVSRKETAALKFSGAAALEKLKKLRQQLEEAVLAALRALALKPADLFELLILARRRDLLGLRSDKDVEGGVECLRVDVLDELDSALDRLTLDNVESAGTVARASSDATDVRRELVRRANELLDDLLCSCSPPSQYELWQYWLDVKGIDQLIACLHDLQLGTWAVKLAQEARRAADATEEFRESTRCKLGGCEVPDHKYIISQESGCRIGLAYVLCEIRQKLRRIGDHQDGTQADAARRRQGGREAGSAFQKRGPQRRDNGNKLKSDSKRAIVFDFLEKSGGWDGTLSELSAKLREHRNVTVSAPQLSRYLKGTRFDRHGKPHRSSKAHGDTEAVAEPSGYDAYTMPDDPDESVS